MNTPTNVGGIYLKGAGESLKDLGKLQGIGFDKNNDRLILLSEQQGEINLPPLRLDDVVTIFRSVYEEGAPYVSIDPDPSNPQGPKMLVRHDRATKDTYVGWVLFEADRVMKAYSLGKDNNNPKNPVKSSIPTYKNLLDLAFGEGSPQWERFWIVPAQVKRLQTGDKALTLLDVPLKVNTQQMEFRNGKLVTAANPQSSTAAKEFSRWFTENYDKIAQEATSTPPKGSAIKSPVHFYTELRRIALVTAIAETLRDRGVPFPAWMRDYKIEKVAVPPTTPAITVERKIYGGVSLAPQDKDIQTQTAAPEVEAIAPELFKALASQPILASVNFQQNGKSYRAVTLPGNNTRDLGGQSLAETDLFVPVAGGNQISLVRQFHSFFEPADVFGGSWTLNLPRLETLNIPISRQGDMVKSRIGHQLTSPLQTWSASFSQKGYVPELQQELLVPDRPGEILALAADNDQRIGQQTKLLLLRDGSRWHFDAAGNFVASQQASFTSVYRRDGNKRISRIESWYGKNLLADIKLTYDAQGRLKSATGSDGSKVTYSYNPAGQLTQVNSPNGSVGYTYEKGLVKAIQKDGKKIREFNYNARGQLESEWNNGMTVNYASQSTAQGIEITQKSVDSSAATPQGSKTPENPADSSQPVNSVQYDAAFRPVRQTFEDGSKIEWQYGEKSETKMTFSLPQGEQYLLTQSPDGKRRDWQLPQGGIYVAEYDSGGHLTKLQQGDRPVLSQQWHPDGQLAAVDSENFALRTEYDPDNALKRVLVASPEPAGGFRHWLEPNYDEFGQVAAVNDSSGSKIQLGYDKTGELAFLSSTQGQVEMTRNQQGQVTEIKTSWGDRQSNTYSGKNGELTGVKLVRGGKEAAIAFEGGKPIQVRQFDGGISRFFYDETNKLTAIATVNAPPLRYQYDETDRLVRVDVGDTYHINYTYDPQGRLQKITHLPLP